MHSLLRLREHTPARSPQAFVHEASYESDLIKRLKLERVLDGHGEKACHS